MSSYLRVGFLLTFFLILNFTARSARCQSTFTLAVMPDTQREFSIENRTDFPNRLQWLVDNQQKLNLKMVLQVGDLVDWDARDHIQFVRASEGLEILEKAKMPYVLAIGNHDTAMARPGGTSSLTVTQANVRVTTSFNTFFPLKRFACLSQTFEKDKIDNATHVFQAGGLDWLVLNLELWPRQEPIDWAKKIVETHPHHNVIILTHSYLESTGEIKQDSDKYGANSPQYLYDQLISQYPNIKLVFSGHTGRHIHRTDTAQNGNTIYAFLQCFHANLTNPVRLLTIDTKAGTMHSTIYCPKTDETIPDSTYTISDVKWIENTKATSTQ